MTRTPTLSLSLSASFSFSISSGVRVSFGASSSLYLRLSCVRIQIMWTDYKHVLNTCSSRALKLRWSVLLTPRLHRLLHHLRPLSSQSQETPRSRVCVKEESQRGKGMVFKRGGAWVCVGMTHDSERGRARRGQCLHVLELMHAGCIRGCALACVP